jgi:integrase
MRVKRGKRGQTWYYLDYGKRADGKRLWKPLGSNFTDALKLYASAVEARGVPPMTVPELMRDWMMASLPGRPIGTLRDIQGSMKHLLKFFGDPPAPLPDVEPHHIRQYLDWREAKSRANREVTWLSAAWNWARDRGKTKAPNPVLGVKRNPERGRDIYIEDDELLALLAHADKPLREAIELAYLTGQRPSDVLGITKDDIRDGTILVEQNKTGKRLRVAIVGDLAALIDRIKARRESIHAPVAPGLICHESGISMTTNMLRKRFAKARKAAAAVATERQAKRLLSIQFRDLRAKAASDVEDLERAQKLLGHSSRAMTEHYVRNRRGEKVPPVR